MFRKSRKKEEPSLLNRQDKKDIMFYVCMGGIIAFSFVIAINSLWVINSRREEAEDMEQIMKTIHAYMSTATEEEFDSFTQKLRNDLVLSASNQDQWQYAKMIENTAKECSMEHTALGQTFIVAVNTGRLYPLDNMDEEENEEGHSVTLTSGYDEISGSSLSIFRESEKKGCDISVDSEKDIISIQMMKKVICDECIQQILEMDKESVIPEFIIYNKKANRFYPLMSDATYQIDEYQLDMSYDKTGTFKIHMDKKSTD